MWLYCFKKAQEMLHVKEYYIIFVGKETQTVV